MTLYKLETEWDFGLNVTNNIGVFHTEEAAIEHAKTCCEEMDIDFDEALDDTINIEEIFIDVEVPEDDDIIEKMSILDEILLNDCRFTQEDREFIMELLYENKINWINIY